MKRSLSFVVGLGLVGNAAGCRSYPGTSLTAGTAITAFATYFVIEVDPTTEQDESPDQAIAGVGVAVGLVGVALMAAGIIGYAQNAAPLEPAPSGVTLTAPTPARQAEATGDHAKLETHIRVAARANRCPAALFMLHELERRAPITAQSLRTGDAHVQRCQLAAR